MTTAATRRSDRRVSPVFVGILAVMGVTGWATWTGFAEQRGVAVFLFVTAAWLVSLCLHEYAHARTALHSGDHTVVEKGYLTLNPLKYTHAVLSILLPLIFVILGGIGLPGGAVYIERGRIRGRWKHSLISAAGPLTNLLFAVLLMLPFTLGAADSWPREFVMALAFLALLQVSVVVLNLLPIPGLDGYGIWEPWLPYNIRRQANAFAPYGLFATFGILYIPAVRDKFWDLVTHVMAWFDVPLGAAAWGHYLFEFWKS
jgi:Zn-dependent protease